MGKAFPASRALLQKDCFLANMNEKQRRSLTSWSSTQTLPEAAQHSSSIPAQEDCALRRYTSVPSLLPSPGLLTSSPAPSRLPVGASASPGPHLHPKGLMSKTSAHAGHFPRLLQSLEKPKPNPLPSHWRVLHLADIWANQMDKYP